MISKEEFLALYEKFMLGNCTPEELELLDAYQDELNLNDNQWHHQNINAQDIRNRILKRIELNSEKPIKSGGNKFIWLKAAAIIIVMFSASLFFLRSNNNKNASQVITKSQTNTVAIPPGSNKAFLVMANGKRITLNDAKQGRLAVQSGIQISKNKNGMLVYHFKSDTGKVSTQLTAFNTIVTPRGGQYQVVLSDGTQVWLNAASSLRFPVNFNGNQRNVELTGEAYFEVAKNKEKPFIVHANGTQVQVLGTHFNVNAYEDNDAVSTTLLEGSVRLQKGQETALIKPGEQGTITNNKTKITIAKSDEEEVMAWKNGYFIFRDENITTIMKQVSRWYDVDVNYADDTVKDHEFGGTISKYKNINELLDNMELTHAIHYKIEGRRVTIMR